MERFLLYLDDLDDLYGMVALMGERLRKLFINAASLISMLFVVVLSASLAYIHPPIALATSILLFVTLLYRSVTQGPVRNRIISS